LKPLKNWEKKDSLFGKISDRFHRTPPLRDKVFNSLYKLNSIQAKLEQLTNKLEQKDRELFGKCAESMARGDEERSKIYANECAQLRKMAKTVLGSQLAIEQAALRLETVKEFGDVAKEMMPVAGVVRSLKGKLVGVMPEASLELNEIGETLNEIMFEAGEVSASAPSFQASGEEAQKILQSASVLAEQKMKEKFPKLPVGEFAEERSPDLG
jgi:division protein CdvB (Snf7/Vps24/ESCRT-III family)